MDFAYQYSPSMDNNNNNNHSYGNSAFLTQKSPLNQELMHQGYHNSSQPGYAQAGYTQKPGYSRKPDYNPHNYSPKIGDVLNRTGTHLTTTTKSGGSRTPSPVDSQIDQIDSLEYSPTPSAAQLRNMPRADTVDTLHLNFDGLQKFDSGSGTNSNCNSKKSSDGEIMTQHTGSSTQCAGSGFQTAPITNNNGGPQGGLLHNHVQGFQAYQNVNTDYTSNKQNLNQASLSNANLKNQANQSWNHSNLNHRHLSMDVKMRPCPGGNPPASSRSSPTMSSASPSDSAKKKHISNSELTKKHNRSGAKNLVLSENLAPWPTSETSLRSPKYGLGDYDSKLNQILKEFFISGDYDSFTEQLHLIRSETYNDLTVARIFRMGLEQRQVPLDRGQPREEEFLVDTSMNNMLLSEMHLRKRDKISGSFTRSLKEGPPSWEKLLVKLLEEDIISPVELMRGLYGYISNISCLEKDVPHASEKILEFLDLLVCEKLIDSVVFYRLPEDILNRAKEMELNSEQNVGDIANELKFYKKILENALSEYFQSLNFARLEMLLRDVSMNLFSHELVKRIVLRSLDSRTTEEERSAMVIEVLQKLQAKGVVQEEDIQHGLAMVLGRLEDVSIDVPHAVRYISKLFEELVKEEIVSADLIKREQNLEYGGRFGFEVTTSVLHATPEYSRKIWSGAGDERCLLREMDLAIAEYFDSYDCEEVARIFGELHLSQSSEIKFIRKILLYSIERRNVWIGLNLVAYLDDILWGSRQIEDAIESLRADSDYISVDIPDISDAISYLCEQAHRYGLVSDEYRRLDQQFQV